MKTLWLIRHAKSSWKDLKLSDYERPLNERGKRDAPFMGGKLTSENNGIQLIVSSPAKRAISTAKKIAKELDYPDKKIDQKHLIYEASFQDLLEMIYTFDDNIDKIAIIGHNPGLTVLSDYLTDYYIDNIPTCGIVKIEFDIENWRGIIKGSGTLSSFIYPKKFLKD